MSTSPLYFTGVSTFSTDFQAILNRQLSIAQVPITQLQNQQTDNAERKQLLTSLNGAVAALASSLAALGAVGNNKGLAATSSDSSVSVSNAGSTQPALHVISNVQSLAKPASETSLTGYADSGATPVSTAGSMQLVVGSTSYAITLTSAKNNLAGLRDAINASDAPVTASILTTGTGATPNYLEVSMNIVGATTLQVNDLPGNGAPPVALLNHALPIAKSGSSAYADTDTTPVSADNLLNLTLGSNKYAITLGPGQNNLTGLMQAINSSGADVTATIADAGAAAGAKRYSLVLTANHIGQTTLELNDVRSGGGSVSLLSRINNNANQGSDAVFQLDGISVRKQTNSINDVIPGMTFALNSLPSGNVTLALSSNRSSVTNALSSLATNYNAVVDQVNAQRGSNAGLLNGDYAVQAVADDMRQLTTYQAPGNNNMSLAMLGITFDTSGKMSFDSTAVAHLTDSQLSDAFKYLGSSTTGFGAIAAQFSQLSDPVRGLIKTEQTGLDIAKQNLTERIATLNDRLSAMQAALTQQLQAADAAVAGLQSQQQVLTASVQAVDLALYGKNWGTAASGG